MRALSALLVAAAAALVAAGPAFADPACGTTVTTSVTLTADIVCASTFTGYGLQMTGHNLTFDGAGHKIIAPNGTGLRIYNYNGTTVRNVELSGSKSGNGLEITGDNATVTNVIADGRNLGVMVSGRNPVVQNSRALAANYGFQISGGGATLRDNDAATSGSGIYLASYTGPVTLERNNLVGASIGIRLGTVVDTTLDNATAGNVLGDNRGTGIYGDTGCANVRLRNFDVSAGGIGEGVNLAGGGHTVENITASGRSHGIYLSGQNHTVRTNTLSNNVYGVRVESGRNLTVTGNTFPGNQLALWLRSYQGALSLEGNDFRTSSGAINFESDVGTTVDNAVGTPNLFGGNVSYGLAGSGSSMIIRNVDFSGSGSGSGISLGGAGNLIENVTASRRDHGIYLQGSNSIVRGCTVTQSNYGIRLNTGPGMTVVNNVSTGNNLGLYLYYYTGTIELRGNDFRQSTTAINFENVIGATIDNAIAEPNLYGNNAGTVMSGYGTNLVFKNLDLSGTGGGYGVNMGGTGNLFENIVSQRRAIGLYLSGSDHTVRDCTLTSNAQALRINYGPRATVVGNDLRNSTDRALYLYYYQGAIALNDNDLRDSVIGFSMDNSNGVTLDNAQAFPNLFGNNPNYGVVGYGADLTVKNLDLSGVGGGEGVALYGPNMVIDSVFADRRTTGLRVAGATPIVRQSRATGCQTGLALYNSGVPSTNALITGNDLRQNRTTAFYASVYSGPITFTSNDLRGSGRGLQIDNTLNTTFDNATAGNLFGGNPDYGVSCATCTSVTFKNLDVSGVGAGVGVYLTGTTNTLDHVTARSRATGTQLYYRGHTIKNSDFSGCLTSMEYREGSEAHILDNALGGSINYGLFLYNYNGATYTGTIELAGNDFTGSSTAIHLEYAQNLVLDNAPVDHAPNVFANNPSYGIQGHGQTITVRNVDLSGRGAGSGVTLSGPNMTVANAIIKDRVYGIDIDGTKTSVTDTLVRGNANGIRVNGSGAQVKRTRICWNTTAGLRNNYAGEAVDASGNFWGTPFGPVIASNPSGTGDVISGTATYAPFLTEGAGCESDLPVKTLELSGVVSGPAGTVQNLRVRGLDRFGAVVGTYTGLMRVSVGDPQAVLPPDAALVGGVGLLPLTLGTVGSWTLTVSDVNVPQLFGQVNVQVLTGTPTRLTLMSGDGQTAAVGTALADPLRVRVTDTYGNPVAGYAVVFAGSGTGSRVSPQNALTGADGVASSVATVGTLAGPSPFTVTAAGLAGSPMTLSAMARPGPAARLLLSGLPASMTAGTTTQVDVASQDQYGNATPDYAGPVRFLADDTQATVPGLSALSGGVGRLPVTLRTAGTRTVTVADVNYPGFSTSAQSSVVAAAASRLTRSSGDGQQTTVGTAAPEPLVVTATDAFGNGVAGVSVTFGTQGGTASVNPSGRVTDAQGRASTLATVGQDATAYDYTASASELVGSPVRFQLVARAAVAGGLRYISGGNQQGTAGRALSAALVVLTTDAYGNRVPNASVTFRVVSGGGSVAPLTVVSDGAGFANATATLGTTAGVQSFEAGAEYTTTKVRFEATAGPAAAQSLRLISGDAQSSTVGHALALPLRVQVQDAYGNGVAGATVDFTADSGGGFVNPTSVQSDTSGFAQGVATLGSSPGENRFGARAAGVTGSVLFRATAASGSGARLTLLGLPATVIAGELVNVTVTALDSAGNVAAGVASTVHFSTSDPRATLPVDHALAAGTATVPLRLGAAGVQTVTVADASGGSLSPVTAVVTVRAGAASTLASVSGDGQSGPAASTLVQPLRVRVTDALGNALGGEDVTFTASGDGVVSPSVARTDTQGVAQAYATLGHAAGPFTYDARGSAAGGAALGGSPLRFAAVALAGSGARLGVAGLPAQTTAGSPVSVTVTAYDAQGNVATAFAGSVRLTSSDVRATLPTASPLTGGVGTFVVRFNTAGSQSLTLADVGGTLSPAVGGLLVLAGPAASLVAVSGEAQAAFAGALLPQPLRARVVDAQGNGVVDTAVTLVPSGDALASPASLRSDASGLCEAFATLGRLAGDYTFEVRASAAGGAPLVGSPLLFHATATAGGGARIGLHGLPAAARAGELLTVSLTAYDAQGNVATSQSGLVALSSSDPAAELPASVSLTLGRGEATLRLRTAGAQSLTAQAAAGALAPGSATVSVGASDAAQLRRVSGDGQSGTAGSALQEPLRVRIVDGFGNAVGGATVRFDASAGARVAPASALTDGDGYAQAYATLGSTVGDYSFTASASDLDGAALLGAPMTFSASAVAGEAVRLSLGDVPQHTVAGETFVVTVTAYDGAGNVATGYTRAVRFTASDSAALLPEQAALAGGVGSFVVTFRTAGAQSLTAVDAQNALPPATAGLLVVPGLATELVLVSGDGQTGAAGAVLPQPLRLRVVDDFQNGVPDQVLTFAAPGDGASVSPMELHTDAQGFAQAYATLGRASGPAEFAASALNAQGLALVGSPARLRASVTGGEVVRLGVSGLPATLAAGERATVRVRALDANGNVAATFNGLVTLSATDPQAVVPASLTLASGEASFQAELRTVGAQTLNAQSAADGSVSGAQSVTVRAGAAARLVATPATLRATAGAGATVGLQLVDAFGNAVRQLIALTVTAGGSARITSTTLGAVAGVGTAHVTGNSDARGAASVTITDLLAEVLNVDATASALAGVRAVVTVEAGGPARLVLRAPQGTSAAACTCVPLEVSAKDAYGNVVRSALPGVLVEVDGQARFSGGDLGGQSGLDTARLAGSLRPDGGGTLLLCDDTAEAVEVRFSQAQLADRDATLTLTFAPGPLAPERSTLTSDASSVSARGGEAHLTVTPRDACGNTLGSGREVTLRQTGPGDLSPVRDEGDGRYTSTLSFAACPAQSDPTLTVGALVDGQVLGHTVTVAVNCIPISPTRTTVTLSAQETLVCGGQGTVTATVTPRDESGVLIGAAAHLTSARPELYIVSQAYAAGTFTLVLGTRACSETPLPVSLAVEGVPVTADDVAVRFRCPTVDLPRAAVRVTPATLVADGLDAATVRIELVDTCGAAARAVPVEVRVSRGAAAPASGSTDATGVFSTRITSTVVGDDVVMALVNGTALAGVPLSYVAPPMPEPRLAGGGGCSAVPSEAVWPAWLALLGLLAVVRRRR